MELAISNDFMSGKLAFKNAALKTATQKIVTGMTNARKGFLDAGITLKRIKDDKLYDKDFFDADGKPSFAMYVETVLGISKTSAYRIIKTTEQLLAPEMLFKSKPAFFERFSDGALDTLTTLGDYDEAIAFCKAYDITETTGRDIVREYVKAYKKGYKTIAEYAAAKKTVEVDVDPEVSTSNASNKTDNATNSQERDYLVFIANLFKSDMTAACELCATPEEEKIIEEIVAQYAD